MKRMLAGLALVAATAALSGCYYYPDYSYVRPVTTYSGGDAYYGSGVTYSGGYYAAPGYYYPGYYGYGCCYAPSVSIGIGGLWYGGSRYYGRGGRYYGGHGGGHGGWSGGHGSWSGHGH
ncbi:hypothetical protein [Dyella sp. ASV21]|uniref:hypothetical protein n=1 Tax=Dyella sp. ASV21 TaxID=2795114 RepID=UPI0018EBFE2B|nr:hypothetical protein [Dyella sp. ASV21]